VKAEQITKKIFKNRLTNREIYYKLLIKLDKTNTEFVMSTLECVKRGEKVTIVSIEHTHHSSFHANDNPHVGHGAEKKDCWGGGIHRLECMGLRVGKTVEMLRNDGHGPILILADQSRLAIGRGIARRITVKSAEENDAE